MDTPSDSQDLCTELEDSKGTQAGKHSLILMVCTVISRVLGLVRTMVVSWAFGASGTADVINFTFNIPNNLRKLLAEGALSSAFLPVIVSSLDKDHKPTQRSRRILQEVLGFQLIILVPLVVLSIIFSPWLMKFLSEFTGEQLVLATSLFRYFIVYLLIISVAAIVAGALQSTLNFIPPGISPILFSLSVIGGIMLGMGTLGPYSMVLGVLIGGCLQLMFLIPFVKGAGFVLRPVYTSSDPDFQRIIKQWAPVVSSSLVFIVSQQISFSLATPLERGSVSALSYAIVFWQLPYGVFAASITTVFFPKMSRDWSSGDSSKIYYSFTEGVNRLALFLIPASILLFAGSEELIAVVLERGEFTRANTLLTAKVLRSYSVGILGIAVYTFMLRFYYAKGEYRKPLIVSIIVATLDLVLSLWLRNTFLSVAGLALAHSLAFSLGACIICIDITRENARVVPNGFRYLMLVCFGNLPMVGVIALYKMLTPTWWIDESFLLQILILLGIGVLFVGTLLLTYKALRLYQKVGTFTESSISTSQE